MRRTFVAVAEVVSLLVASLGLCGTLAVLYLNGVARGQCDTTCSYSQYDPILTLVIVAGVSCLGVLCSVLAHRREIRSSASAATMVSLSLVVIGLWIAAFVVWRGIHS